MQARAGLEGQRLQKVDDEVRIDCAEAGGSKLGLDHGIGSPAQVDDDLGQGFVEGREGVTHADEPAAVAQSFVEGLPQGDGHIFDGVVFVHHKIASRPHGQVE